MRSETSVRARLSFLVNRSAARIRNVEAVRSVVLAKYDLPGQGHIEIDFRIMNVGVRGMVRNDVFLALQVFLDSIRVKIQP